MAETRFHDPDSLEEGDVNFDSVGWNPSASGSTVVPQAGGLSATTRPCLSTSPMNQRRPSPTPLDWIPGSSRLSVPHDLPGFPYSFQPRLSSPPPPTYLSGLALSNFPSRSPSVQSSSFPLEDSPLHERDSDPGRSSLPVTTDPPLNRLDVESSRSVQSTQPSDRVSFVNTGFKAVPPSVGQPLMMGPFTNEKRGKRPREEAMESRKRRREHAENAPAKVASPPRPKARPIPQKKAINMRPSPSMTSLLSTSTPLSAKYTPPAILAQDDSLRSRRRGECLPEARGHTGDAMRRQNTSPTRLPDPLVQDVCRLFLSVDFGKPWVDAVHRFQDFENLHPSESNPKAKLSSVNRPICVHEWIKRKRSVTYQPDANALSTISQDFHSWWKALQPEWRVSKGNKGLKKANGDWSRLRISGANGFLSVMAALFFWRSSLESPDDINWKAALEDVGWALKCMVATAVS